MNWYTLFWLTGTKELLKGNSIAEAMNNAGYSSGAVRALDFWAIGDNNEYTWDTTDRKWKNNQYGS